MLQYRYDTQMLIDGEDLDEDEIRDYITEHFDGACSPSEETGIR